MKIKKDKKRKDYLIYWFSVVISIVLLFSILSPLIFNNPAFIDKYDMHKYGYVGQGISGFILPFIGLIGALLTFAAFYVQYKANQKIQEQFKVQQSSDHFYKMLDLHLKNVDQFNIKSYAKSYYETGLWDVESSKGVLHQAIEPRSKELQEIILGKGQKKITIKPNKQFEIEKNLILGKNCFILMLKDLHYCIEKCVEYNNDLITVLRLSNSDILNLAYRIFFWGTNSNHIYPPNTNSKSVDIINDKLHQKRLLIRRKRGELTSFKYKTHNPQRDNEHEFRFVPFSGHSTRLAHYYRHLYQTAKHIHQSSEFKKSEFIGNENIDYRFNTLRAQLSNEEQLLLYYNYLIGFGGKWDKRYDDFKLGSSEFLFLTKYKMIHNIPLYDTIHHLVENPLDHFKPYIEEYPNSDLFEWLPEQK